MRIFIISFHKYCQQFNLQLSFTNQTVESDMIHNFDNASLLYMLCVLLLAIYHIVILHNQQLHHFNGLINTLP